MKLIGPVQNFNLDIDSSNNNFVMSNHNWASNLKYFLIYILYQN